MQLDRVRIERGRTFGDVWLGWQLWRALKFDELLAELLPAGREKSAWSQTAAILVIARLCEPSSELHVAEDWYRRTALEDVIGVPTEHVYDARLYRSLDQMLPHKEAIEKHLVTRLGELFAIEYDLLLYDVTSTYFEGGGAPEICQRGYSRDHRPDCVQVNIALVVTKQGFPLGYELFAGNRTDVTTVEEIVTAMEARYGKVDRVWVMDRGMVSADNIEWLQEGARRYVLGAPTRPHRAHPDPRRQAGHAVAAGSSTGAAAVVSRARSDRRATSARRGVHRAHDQSTVNPSGLPTDANRHAELRAAAQTAGLGCRRQPTPSA